MPLIGGILLILQIAVAVHAIRTGRPIFWVFLVVFVPLVGLAAYAIVELIPEYAGGNRRRRAASAFGRAVDPGRSYRRLRDEVDNAPTVQNMLALGNECLELERFAEAAELFKRCLQGVHADDPAVLFGLAAAEFGSGDAKGAREHLERLVALPGYRSPEAHLLLARTMEADGDLEAARKEYESLIDYFPGPEAACRFAQLLQRTGEPERANAIFVDIAKRLDRSPRHVRRLHREWYDIAARNAR